MELCCGGGGTILNSWRNGKGELVVEHGTGLRVLARGQTVEQFAAQERDEARVAEVERELARPGNERIVATLNDVTGAVTAAIVPTPYFKLSATKRTELEHQAETLQRIIADRQSNAMARKRAQTELEQIQRLLQIDGSSPPSPPAPDRSSSSGRGAGGGRFAEPVPYWTK